MTGTAKHPAVKQVKTQREDVYAFEIYGHVSRQEIDDIYQTLEKAYENHDKINLLVRMSRFDGVDWSAVFSEAVYIGKFHAIKHMRRYALVGGPKWAAVAMQFFNPLFRLEVRHFELEQEAEAWDWIYEHEDSETAAA